MKANERAKLKIQSLTLNETAEVEKGAEIIKRGGLVAFPTETVYGLGANALNAAAVASIYETKGRPSDNPLILHVSSVEMAAELVKINDMAIALMEKFWPGPLSVVLPVYEDKVPPRTRGGLDTAAVRMPDAAIALALIEKSGIPIAAPSANISGRPSPTDAETIRREIGKKIPLVIDGGETKFGVESTVVDLTGKNAVILRPGGVSKEMLEAALAAKVLLPQDQNIIKRSPGTRYRHYAPLLPLRLCKAGDTPKDNGNWAWIGTSHPSGNPKVKVLFQNTGEYAKELFRTLRKLEESGTEIIYAEIPDDKGIGSALKDRLIRAAGE
ncbi:MAG: L-threonylcarbamoyladenylate synthase [Synergistes sp.]|nr:L-threonylcarbamoyladenylate synthase [Synergistes sp.]